MTKSSLKRLFAIRIVRLVILCAILLALAAGASWLDHPSLGLSFLIAAIAMAAAFFVFVIRPARIPRDAVLTLRLSGALPEEPHRSLVDQLRGRLVPPLSHLRYALEEVRRDPAIRAVMVEVAGIDNGLATAEELHDLLRRVRESGKRVVAVLDGESAGVRDYLVASAANEIICNPETMVTMLGVSAGGVFLKRAFEKLHVQVQTLQYKEYKGAAEMFSRESMSPPLRESLQAIIGDWRQVLTERIARARNIPLETAAELVGRGFMSARDAHSAGLVDREGYAEDVRGEFDPEGKRKKFVGLGRYLRHAAYMNEGGERHRIAVVCGIGPVISGDPSMTGDFISPETTGAQSSGPRAMRMSRQLSFGLTPPADRRSVRTWYGARCGPRRAGENRWSFQWATSRDRAAITSRRVPTRSSHKPRPSPDRSGWCTRSSMRPR